MQQSRIITIDELRREIREYGGGKLSWEIGFSRQYVARVANGQRKPSPRFLEKLEYQAITVYKDLTPNKNAQ
jgi:hypothetical protein